MYCGANRTVQLYEELESLKRRKDDEISQLNDNV